MKLAVIAACLIMFGLAVPSTATVGGQSLRTVERSSDTLATSVDVHTLTRTVLYAVPVTVQAGDRVHVHGRAQVSNKLGYNVMAGFEVRRTTGPAETTGWWPVRATAENVTPAMHHIVRVGQGWDEPPEGTWWYNVIVYAASSVSQEGDMLTVDPYGIVEVAVYRE